MIAQTDVKAVSILIVDDEEDFARTLSSRLELRGYCVHTAFGGEEGLSSMVADPPDVLLLDMRMPGLSGPEVLAKLRHERPFPGSATLPVIIVTGHCTEQDTEEVRKLGVSGYHTKPLNLEELLESISTATRHM